MGLGNPGRKYADTRHNVGFWIVEALAESLGLRFSRLPTNGFEVAENDFITCVKPLTYMNTSGEIFSQQPGFRPSEDRKVVVVCDNMDLAPGELRIKQRGGTAGHNGLKSIVAAIGEDFWPLYVGIGRPAIGSDVITHVLGVPAGDEMDAIVKAKERAVAGILSLARKSIEEVMNDLNTRQTKRV